MFRRFRSWLEEHRRWNEEHRRTWAGVRELGPDGLSAFQRRTEAAIREVVAARGVEIASREFRRIVGDAENYVLLTIPDPSITIWIYRDQVDVKGSASELRLEKWDARTPEEHRAQVLDFLESLI